MLFKTHTILAYALMAIGLAACNDAPQSAAPAPASVSASTVAASVAKAPAANLPTYKVRIADEPYPPFNIFNSDRSFTGLDTDILEAIGRDQHIQFEFEPYPWELIFTDLKEKNTAIVSGGLAKDDFDDKVVSVSVPYMRSPDCVVAANETHLTQWNKGAVSLIESDENDDTMVDDFGVSRKNIVPVRTQYQALQNVSQGVTPSAVSDCSVLRYSIKQSFADKNLQIKELPIEEGDEEGFDLRFGVRSDETELLQKINQGIENIKKSGELDKILQKWL